LSGVTDHPQAFSITRHGPKQAGARTIDVLIFVNKHVPMTKLDRSTQR
jgi:hypothetical protein